MATKKSSTNKNKAKGSAFERELAEKLSIWVYGEPKILRRHPTSGAEKDLLFGADLGLLKPGYSEFNYFVEAKRGYKVDIFNARKQILEWYNTAKTKNKSNLPIWIVWKLLSRGILFVSDKKINKTQELFCIDNLFVYDLKDVLNTPFNEI